MFFPAGIICRPNWWAFVVFGCVVWTDPVTAEFWSPGARFQDCEQCPAMVVVPAGSFVMGDSGSSLMRDGSIRPHGPLRAITLPERFAVGRFEVTEGEFAAFISATGIARSQACTMLPVEQIALAAGGDSSLDASRLPVVCVSWLEAEAYTNWLSDRTGHRYRLLSEAEWEYVAGAGSPFDWPWGDDASEICLYGNVLDQSALQSLADHPASQVPGAAARCDDQAPLRSEVGRYRSNAFGVHDMIGNVWEWVADCSVLPYPDAPTDGAAVLTPQSCSHRAIRGGSWRTRLERQRISFRGRDPETTTSDIFGFRVARELAVGELTPR